MWGKTRLTVKKNKIRKEASSHVLYVVKVLGQTQFSALFVKGGATINVSGVKDSLDQAARSFQCKECLK